MTARDEFEEAIFTLAGVTEENGFGSADKYVRQARDAWDALAADVARLTEFGRKIEAIMDSICGAQKVNWSEHIYPLRAALDEAGFPGLGYEEARAGVGTLIENVKALELDNERLNAEVEALRKTMDVPIPRARYECAEAHPTPASEQDVDCADLAPCPFCGEQCYTLPVVTSGFELRFVAVQCPACGAQGPLSDTPENSAAAWGRRHGDEAKPSTTWEEVDALRAKVARLQPPTREEVERAVDAFEESLLMCRGLLRAREALVRLATREAEPIPSGATIVSPAVGERMQKEKK